MNANEGLKLRLSSMPRVGCDCAVRRVGSQTAALVDLAKWCLHGLVFKRVEACQITRVYMVISLSTGARGSWVSSGFFLFNLQERFLFSVLSWVFSTKLLSL